MEEKQKEVQEKAREEALKENQKVLNSIKEAKTPKDKEREDLLDKIGRVLREYGEESNIPINHDYWNLTAQYRALK